MAKSSIPRRPPKKPKEPAVAKPPAVPKKRPKPPVVTRCSLLPAMRLIARDSGELVFSNTTTSQFVDAKQWPPSVGVMQVGHALFAARHYDASWRIYATEDAAMQTWTIRMYDSIRAEAPTRVEADPIPFRDFTPFQAALDEEAARRERQSHHRIEGLAACGPFPVVVPRYCGLGELQRPFVKRGGAWAEDTSLPPLDKFAAHAASMHPTRCATIINGPSILVWKGRLYVPLADHFIEYCAATISLGSEHCAPVPVVGGGLMALQGTQLVEVMIDTVREHLPGISVSTFQPGPGGTVIVQSTSGPILYDPAKRELAELGPLVGESEIATASAKGDLILFDRAMCELHRITRRELAALERRPFELAPEPPAPPVKALDALGAASRPTMAASGDVLVSCTDDAVRFWNLDIPFAKLALSAIAVAVRGERTAVLDARGVLHELATTTGTLLASRPVTEQPRSLARTPDRWIVIAKDAVSTVGERVERIEVAGALAAAADPDGTIVILAEDRRLARWEGGQLFDIPESIEQLVAIAPLGGRRFVCAGQRNLFLLDLAQLELEALYEQSETPFLATSPNGRVVAWSTEQSVSVATLVGTKLEVIESAHYTDTFTEPDDIPLRVRGLGFLDDERVAIAITAGYGGNILDFVAKKTKKLDPHPGDIRNRFLFTYAGVILIAEDP